MSDNAYERRQFLRGAGAVATMGALAGCTGGGSGGSGGSGGDSTTTGTEGTTTVRVDAATESTTAETTSSSPYLQPAPKTVDQFLLDQNPFYDGNMVVGIPFVGVGAGEEDTGFDPAAIKVSTGTEVTWEWASGDKPHNVVRIAQTGTEEVAFDSGDPQRGNNTTYRYTFEEPGIYRYVCTTHRDSTGRGAVVVVDEPVGIGGDATGTTAGSETTTRSG